MTEDTLLYGRTVLRGGVRVSSNADEFSITPRSPAHAADMFHDDSMAVGCKTRGEFNREWAHRLLDEWFDRVRPQE